MNETLTKYLSGLFDADGSVSFAFLETKKGSGLYRCGLRIEISASSAVDRHNFILGLPKETGFGGTDKREYPNSHSNNEFFRWSVQSSRDVEMIIPRLIKHSCVKARHMQRMLDAWREGRGIALSKERCDELREFSKQSRCDSGPMKPKNHPTWAWLSGYIDGNGTLNLAKYKSKKSVTCKVSLTCHKGDAQVLEFVQEAHGGYIYQHGSNANCMVWKRNLGNADRSFALRFLPELVRHSRLKRHKLEEMISFHHQQRLTEWTSTEGVIV
jgi:hypothetical protein